MQEGIDVGVDVTCMHIKFGGGGLSGFGVNFIHFPIVHEGQKIQSNSVGSNSYLSNHQSRLLFDLDR